MVRWPDGMFKLDMGDSGFERLAAESHVDDVFLKLLQQFERQRRTVTDKTGTSFAPKVFANHPSNEGIASKAFTHAMKRLLTSGKILIVWDGPPSKRRSRLVVNRGCA